MNATYVQFVVAGITCLSGWPFAILGNKTAFCEYFSDWALFGHGARNHRPSSE